MKNSALLASSLVFTVVAIAHLARYVLGWDLIIGEYYVPLQGSLIAGVATTLLAIWTFIASRVRQPNPATLPRSMFP